MELSLIVVLLPLILFLIFLYKLNNANKYKLLPPYAPRLPILGNLHQMSSHPHIFLQSMSVKYGDIMMVHYGGTPVLVASSARAAREILKTHDTVFLDRPDILPAAIKKLLFNCKDVGGAPYGESWRHKKSIFTQLLLSNKKVRSLSHVRDEEMGILLEIVTKAANSSSPVNLTAAFMSFTTKVICRVAFGSKYCDKAAVIDFDTINEILGTASVGDFFPSLSWISRVNGWNAKVDKVFKEVDHFFEGVIREYEDDLVDHKYGTEGGEENPGTCFVDALLYAQNRDSAGFVVDRESMKGFCMDMLIENGSSTALLEWAMIELMRHPQVMKELQDEVRGVVGVKTLIYDTDLEQMKYLKAVIKETLRLHPPEPIGITRQSIQDVTLDNRYKISAGTTVIVNSWAVHRDPTVWDEPDSYKPSRFLTSKSSVDFRGQHFELIPFGSGKRMCPGISFAMAKTELLLANLVHQFDWSSSEGKMVMNLDIEECPGVFVRIKNPLIVFPKRKHIVEVQT